MSFPLFVYLHKKEKYKIMNPEYVLNANLNGLWSDNKLQVLKYMTQCLLT